MKYERIKCSECIHAHKIEDEYDKVYECDAEEYDIETFSCFEEKEVTPSDQSGIPDTR